MRTITYEGDTWEANSAGGSYHADHQDNMGVNFRNLKTQRMVVGRLPITPANFAAVSDDELRKSLATALQASGKSN